MPKDVKVTCDGCGRDLTHTSNSIGYRLALKVERLQTAGGAVTDVMIYPPLDRDAYFCGTLCLSDWWDLR